MSWMVFKSGKDKFKTLPTNDLFSLSVKDIDGKERILKEFLEGKKVLIFVNVASSWGLTTVSYTELASIYEKYSSKGLEILGFPCNQFMSQENKCESEIKRFVIDDFGVKFPMFSKIEVNGDKTNEIYRYLKYHTPSLNKGDALVNIPWNFSKFVVDNKGKVIEYFDPKQNPNKMISLIEKLL